MSAADREKRPAHILLVEDSRTQAMQLTHLLDRYGHATSVVESAEAALEHLERELPDLVITDLNLPGASGEELCRRMRMALNTRAVPIMLLTSEAGAAIETRLLESGADDFVSKSDGDAETLLLRVQALLRKSNVREVLSTAARRVGTVKVLVVEDSATYRQLLLAELGQEGYRLAQAETGAQALALLAMEPFDVVVLDLVLPDMSGAEICRRMAESRRTLDNAVLVMALTASETREDMGALLAAGADDVIGKSQDMAVIRARVRAMVRRKLLFDENGRITREFQERERALLRERAERQVAEARAALVGELERANRELKETQSQLVQSAKMASLGQLVAGIAHEINNPVAFVAAHLQTVIGLCDEVAAEARPHLSGAATKKLERVHQRLKDSGLGLERVRDLVLKLRTFSRLDEGEFKVASVRENVEAVLTMLRHRTEGRIRLVCRFGAPDRIGCYPGLLNQALMNIISNSIEAIDGEGEIRITSGACAAGYEIEVQDSGRGIPAGAREHIFEPFYTTKPVGEGTGLGMSITYQIVRRHGGSIAFESEEGRGTRMVIRLPLEGAPQALQA